MQRLQVLLRASAMKTQRVAQVLVLSTLTVALLLVSASSVIASDPTGSPGIPWPTTMIWPTARPLKVGEVWSPGIGVLPTATPIPAIVLAPKPAPLSAPVIVLPNPSPMPVNVPAPAPSFSGGTDPSNPLNPTGVWQTLNAGTSVWYRIGSNGVHMDVWLDAVPHSNISMAIYAPYQWHKPIGYGTPFAKDPSRLVWSGGHWDANGDWLAKISNNNPMAIRYLLSSSARDISNKSCSSYWEYIGPNLVYWTHCE